MIFLNGDEKEKTRIFKSWFLKEAQNRGWVTQKQAANSMGITESYLSSWLSGKWQISLQSLHTISKNLEMTFADLVEKLSVTEKSQGEK